MADDGPFDDFLDDLQEDPIELTRYEDLQADGTMLFEASEEASQRARFSTGELEAVRARYAMVGSVGEGAMGEIMLAVDQSLRRKVAYKKVHAQMAQNAKVMSRFFTEAQITAQLDHPNIVPIYSLEVSETGEIGYSMKLIKGKTLKDLIREARQQWDTQKSTDDEHSLDELLGHFLKVCDAMHYAHNKAVIHRDLKPANIMIGAYNEVYVMDWGIAKVIHYPERKLDTEVVELIQPDPSEPPMERTQMGQIVGTPRYLSPQQAAGKVDILDGRSDQFALGLILFELVCLKPALKANSQVELIKKILKVELEPFQHYHPRQKIPKELQAIIRKATGKKPEQRYDSVEEMADDIRRYLRGEAVLAQPDTALQRVTRWVGKHKELALGLMLSLTALSVGVIAWSVYQQQAAMLASQQHQQRLTAFLMTVGQRAQLIDSQFLQAEALLERMVGSAQSLLLHGQPQSGPVYTDVQIGSSSPPPDLSYSSFYDLKLTLDYNTFKLAPGLQRQELEPLMRQLKPMAQVLREVQLKSMGPEALKASAQKQRQLLLEEGAPLIWVYVGLESGLHVSYPGKSGYHPDYDPRKRPWYSSSLDQSGPRWLKPYVDTGGKGWVLPCTSPVRDDRDQLLGVAGVEMTLDYIKQNFLGLAGSLPVLNSYLLDDQARIVVSSQDDQGKFEIGTLINKARELKPYPHPELAQRILARRSGYDELSAEKKVLAYYPINSLGWYYLVELDAERWAQDAP